MTIALIRANDVFRPDALAFRWVRRIIVVGDWRSCIDDRGPTYQPYRLDGIEPLMGKLLWATGHMTLKDVVLAERCGKEDHWRPLHTSKVALPAVLLSEEKEDNDEEQEEDEAGEYKHDEVERLERFVSENASRTYRTICRHSRTIAREYTILLGPRSRPFAIKTVVREISTLPPRLSTRDHLC